MRIFRIKARNKNNRVINQRGYLGLDNLRLYGRDVWRRYNSYATAELYEMDLNGNYVQETDQEKVRRLMNPYLSDITN